MVCHDPADAEEAGHLAAFPNSVHGQIGVSCVDCHVDLAGLEDFGHAEELQPADCTSCHAEASQLVHQTAHGQLDPSDWKPVTSCTDCHGVHDTLASSDAGSRTNHFRISDTCLSCHGADESIAPNSGANLRDSIHGHALIDAGLTVAPNCATCHGAHDIRAPTDSQSRVHYTAVADNCGTCHEGILTQYAHGIHSEVIADGEMAAATCTSCHSAHEVQLAGIPSWRLDVIRECGTCHEQSQNTYRDTFHGKVTSLGFERMASCSDCHGAHGIRPASDEDSMIHPANLVATCQTCHEGINGNFALYDPHPDPLDRERNAVLYYAAKFMKWLLIGVFSFFFIHTALWLPRSYIARRSRDHDAH